VLRQQPPEHPWDATWAFVIRAMDERSCRLLARSRTATPVALSGRLAQAAAGIVMDPVVLLMERGMLRGIKARAEQSSGCGRFSAD
jgi:hypothetical protein